MTRNRPPTLPPSRENVADPPSSSAAASMSGTSGFPSSSWGNDIWSSRPTGTAVRNNSDSTRLQARPPPLARAAPSSGYQREESSGTPDDAGHLRGSGSLLATSESEPFSRNPWASMGTISAPQTAARNLESNVSPVAQRSAHMPRTSSPYFLSQRGGEVPDFSNTAPNTSRGRSLLDPTSRSFDFPASPQHPDPYNPSDNYGTLPSSSHGERSGLGQIQFGNINASGNPSYSGQSSRAASRNGNMPSSRGSDFASQFEQYPLPSHQQSSRVPEMLSHASEVLGHRPNQLSRNSTFSNYSSGRTATQPWQSSPNNLADLNDLTAAAGRMNLGRFGVDPADTAAPYNSFQQHLQEDGFGATPGRYNGSSSAYRPGSSPFEADNALAAATNAGYNPRVPYQFHSGSATGRQSHNSPRLLSHDTPSLTDHTRTHSSASNQPPFHGSNSSLADNQYLVDRKLQRLQEQRLQDQQVYLNSLPNPNLQHLRYPSTVPSTYGYDLMQQQRIIQYYQMQNAEMGGGYGPHAPGLQLLPPGFMPRAPPRGPARDEAQEPLRSALLESFKDKQNLKRWELKDIYKHVVEFSGDQHGSRFIQGKLEQANSDDKAQLFAEILPNALQLMTDVFGNYVVQKFFEHGNQTQKKQLADKMRGHIAELSVQMYGCRVVQKAFEHVLTEQQAVLVKELEHQVIKCVRDQNGNHVIQKAIERIPAEHIGFILHGIVGEVATLAAHMYGCRVVQRMLEHSPEPVHATVLAELHACAPALVVDQYGNYVVQHVLARGAPADRARLHAVLRANLVPYAKHKFASNVVECALAHGDADQRQRILALVWPEADRRPDGPPGPTLSTLARDQYGNYVVQTFLRILEPPVREPFRAAVRRTLDLVGRANGKSRQIEEIERALGPDAGLRAGGPPAGRPASRAGVNRSLAAARFVAVPAPLGAHGPPPPPQHLRSAPQPPCPPRLDLSTAPTPPLVNEDSQSPQSSSQPSTSSSTMDGPVAGGGGVGKPQPVVRVEFADDETITADSVTTPKAT